MLSTPLLVARIRAATGDTQEALARRLGVSFPTVNAWERGRSLPRAPYRRLLEQVADEFGVVHNVTLLVIDDDPVTAALVEAAAGVADDAIAVESTTDGFEGLLKCGALKPDVVFLDIMMPGIDGIEVARRIPTIGGLESTTVVFVTSSRDRAILDRAQALGHDIMFKPLELDGLIEGIRSLVGEPS
jgi:CheY-like chemotaxis protein